MKGMVANHRGRWLGGEMVAKSGWLIMKGIAKQRGRWLGRDGLLNQSGGWQIMKRMAKQRGQWLDREMGC
jgi:hypothetical protein